MVLKLAIDARKFLSAAKFSRSIFNFLLPEGPRASSLPPPLARGVGTLDRPHPLYYYICGVRIYFPKMPGSNLLPYKEQPLNFTGRQKIPKGIFK